MKNKWIVAVVVVVLLACILLFVQVPSGPDPDTRIILEHTYETYIAPSCFEQAKTTNNIAETVWSNLDRYSYKAESVCTEEALAKVNQPLWYVIANRLF